MDFGIQFFPDVGPAEKTGKDYWQEALDLVAICDELGYMHVRTVEHYFNPYGGYSPNPIVFLPHEFARFGVSVHESRERFDEGMEQVRRLLEEEDVTIEGKFHSFKNVTS